MHLRFHRLAVAAAVAGTAVASFLAAAPASAVTPDSSSKPGFSLAYDATGSTTLTNPDSAAKVTFAPTVLTTFISLDAPDASGNNYSATLPLAPVQAAFKAYGFLPARGTVVFTQVRPIVGKIDLGVTPYSVTGTAFYVVSLRDVTIGGAAANVGTNCQTIRPVKVAVKDGGDFDLFTGTLNGVYDLGRFQNCGAASNIINDTLPGKANTLQLHISLADDASRANARTMKASARTS